MVEVQKSMRGEGAREGQERMEARVREGSGGESARRTKKRERERG
jgi:hypothetical protein